MKLSKGGFIYILTNVTNNVLYIGVTSDLPDRIHKHRISFNPNSFTSRYKVFKLVYFEDFSLIGEAIGREKQLKAGSRKKKVDLINKFNPEWKDLFEDLPKIL